MAARFFAVGEEAGRFDDDIDAEILPWKRGRSFLDGEASDLVSVNDQHVVFGRGAAAFFAAHFALIPSLGGIVFDQVSKIVRGHEIVDGDDIDFFAEQSLITDCAKDEPTDASETVNAECDHDEYV